MNENLKDGTARTTARRRLIRGAFAAPAALTLCSGSAFAQASNKARCVANQVTFENATFPPVGSADTWVRVQVWTGVNASNVTAQLVSGDDVFALQGTANNSFILTNQWRTIASPFDLFDPVGTPTVVANQYVALRVDASGFIVGVSDGNSVLNTSAVGKSCWTSFSGVQFMP